MSKLRAFFVLAFLFFNGLTTFKAFAATHTYTIDIRRKVNVGATPASSGPYQISTVRLTLSFATDSTSPPTTLTGITLSIREPDNKTDGSGPETWGPIALMPGISTSHTFQTPPAIGIVQPVEGDRVHVFTPDSAGYDTDRYQRYEIDIDLYSNQDSSCKGTQVNDPDTYTITVDVTTSDAAHPAKLSGECLESYDYLNRSTMTANCSGGSPFFVPGPRNVCSTPPSPPNPPPGVDCPAKLNVDGTDIGAPSEQVRCFKERPGVDAFLVLDKSGSMASSTLGGDPEPKIEALREAVQDLVSAWQDARSFDTPPSPSDNIGVVLFDNSAISWTDPGLSAGLNTFAGADANILSHLSPNCSAVTPPQLCPGTSTSIGSGLVSADAGFPNDGNRHVILLMSDGMQNSNPMVRPFDPADPTNPAPANPTRIATYSLGSPNVAQELPHEFSSKYQVHAVTVGTGLAVSAAVNQDLAHASQGFYINTEDDASQLKPFFLELLQNVLKFNSYETVRMISKAVPSTTFPFSASVPISTTTHDVEFDLSWPKSAGAMRLTVTPPGGASPIVKEGSGGFLSVIQPLPIQGSFDPTKNWVVTVDRPASPPGITVAPRGNTNFSFNIYVMADDSGVKSDLSVVPGDYKPGDKLHLSAKLTQFGNPILHLGTHSGDKIQVDLIKPGQSIGDILSTSTASATPPPSHPDVQQGAEAKLFNTLQNNPSALKRVADPPIQLFDDGKAEHGDSKADDGIYSALYPVTLPGHYNFLFSIESTDPSAVRFSRQQLRTAYVRAVPDADKTQFQSSVSGKSWSIVMTPRAKAGDRMGPGWANYFWFDAPGMTPVKPKDNLDGTYTVSVPLAGGKLPDVSVHFENAIAIIADSVTPSQLPQPIDSKNVLAKVPPPSSRWAFFLDAGAGVPQGTFSTLVNTGFSFNAGLEYLAASHFSVEGVFGYHHFPGRGGSSQDVYQFSANAKAYFTNPQTKLRPFLNFGPGGYQFSPGPGEFGGNIGAGLLYQFKPRFGLQGSYNFHAVNTPGGATEFSTFQGGVRFVF